MSRNLSHLSSRHDPGALHDTVQSLDLADREALAAAETRFHVGEASLVGAASFYDFLRPEHRAKAVFLCDGTSCELAGTQPALRDRLRRHFPDAAIGTMRCLGRCHTNHAFQYQGRTFSASNDAELDSIIVSHTHSPSPRLAVGSNLTEPILTSAFAGMDATYSTLERTLRRSSGELIEEMIRSRISGRGGAHFPTGRKWAACRAAVGSPKYIVCNADEGDPGAFSDRFLLEERPHLVLLGMILAGYAVGANAGIVYIRGEYPEAIAAVESALTALRGARWLGENICGSGFRFDVHVFRGAGAYIVGEETALLAAIEGQRPEVRIRPPYPAEEGLFRKPTIVNNVMTLALVPWIAAHGGAAFARLGTEGSSGPLLVTLDGRFSRPGVYEIEMGTPLREVVYSFGAGFAEPVKAIQTGGPLGGVVPISMIDALTLDHESFESAGFSLGHGSFVGIPERVPMIEFMAHLFEFTAAESCGKCFPCRLGSQRGAEMLRRAIAGEGAADPLAFGDLLDALKETSLCGLGGGLPLPIRNILDHFAGEVGPFFAGGAQP
jgi:NADH-quinone oxidoreductase subunit F